MRTIEEIEASIANLKPLTNIDVANIKQFNSKMVCNSDKDIKELYDIYKFFMQNLNKIITSMSLSLKSRRDEMAEIDSLKRLINLIPDKEEEIFIRCYFKVWEHREIIMEKNIDYFMNKDYTTMVKKDDNESIIKNLINIIKTFYKELSEEEQDQYWKLANNLLVAVARYNKLLLKNGHAEIKY